MASLRKATTFTRKITAQVPSGDEFIAVPFTAEFRLLKQDQIAGRKDSEVLRDALVSVSGLTDENGSPLSPAEQIDDVIAFSPASSAAINVYVSETTKVEAGNSRK